MSNLHYSYQASMGYIYSYSKRADSGLYVDIVSDDLDACLDVKIEYDLKTKQWGGPLADNHAHVGMFSDSALVCLENSLEDAKLLMAALAKVSGAGDDIRVAFSALAELGVSIKEAESFLEKEGL